MAVYVCDRVRGWVVAHAVCVVDVFFLCVCVCLRVLGGGGGLGLCGCHN